MSPLQVWQPGRSFVRTLLLCLLVSLWTQSISAWIQQQCVVSDHPSRVHCRGHYHKARAHRHELLDEESTPNTSTVGKTWNTMPERQGEVSPAHSRLSRRSIIFNIILLSTTTTTKGANAADGTGNAVDIDPFATLDSIASGFGSLGPSPPTTKVGSPQVPTTAAAAETNRDLSTNTGNLSALEKALEESRKRKQIDPRTHG